MKLEPVLVNMPGVKSCFSILIPLNGVDLPHITAHMSNKIGSDDHKRIFETEIISQFKGFISQPNHVITPIWFSSNL